MHRSLRLACDGFVQTQRGVNAGLQSIYDADALFFYALYARPRNPLREVSLTRLGIYAPKTDSCP